MCNTQPEYDCFVSSFQRGRALIAGRGWSIPAKATVSAFQLHRCHHARTNVSITPTAPDSIGIPPPNRRSDAGCTVLGPAALLLPPASAITASKEPREMAAVLRAVCCFLTLDFSSTCILVYTLGTR